MLEVVTTYYVLLWIVVVATYFTVAILYTSVLSVVSVSDIDSVSVSVSV